MDPMAPVTVVRLGHRPGRDERVTTHVALVARAFGAQTVVLPASAGHVVETVTDVSERFGTGIDLVEVDDPQGYLEDIEGPIAHLTMYGLPIQETIDEVRAAVDTEGLTVVVGGGKVPGEVFERATWNVAVTDQPHSEIAALAVFLDRFSDGAALATTFEDGRYQVVPTAAGKRIEARDEE